ncbi:E3 ubiquitin-protein ligase hrd1 [Geranomyces variabilis]|uniref:RING-type E3 ubiquitin transferase n=1 Tax=Geranomyces variabilis TaxID=109894 RepID=A0AAD5TJN0_9FUNG|nr:E3 ubiquitin-protein ligase hrd1 [Geranomyces variabilis]
MRFVLYGCASVALTAAVMANAWLQRAQFFTACIHITRSSASLMVLLNMGLYLTVVIGKALQRLFFGQLRAMEVEHLYERSWFAVTETCLAMTIFRDQFDVRFIILFALLLLVKIFHWIIQDRVDFMEQSANPSVGWHVRMQSVMGIMCVVDLAMVLYSVQYTTTKGASMMIIFGFEYTILLSLVLSTFVKYLLHSYDLRRDRPWEEKSMYIFYVDLMHDFEKLVTYFCFFGIVVYYYSLPLHILRDLYMTLRSFVNRCRDLVQYRRATANMNERYPDATPEELAATDRVCIICREEMESGGGRAAADQTAAGAAAAGVGAAAAGAGAGAGAPAPAAPAAAHAVPPRPPGHPDTPKKLHCGHIFHFHCLRSWLERQQSCPTCRRSVLEQPAPAAAVPPVVNPAAAGQPGNAVNDFQAFLRQHHQQFAGGMFHGQPGPALPLLAVAGAVGAGAAAAPGGIGAHPPLPPGIPGAVPPLGRPVGQDHQANPAIPPGAIPLSPLAASPGSASGGGVMFPISLTPLIPLSGLNHHMHAPPRHPAPPVLDHLTDDQLRLMEGQSRSAISARIRALHAVQEQITGLVTQLAQISMMMGEENATGAAEQGTTGMPAAAATGSGASPRSEAEKNPLVAEASSVEGNDAAVHEASAEAFSGGGLETRPHVENNDALMLTGHHGGDPRQNNAPSALTRILTALAYEPPDDASANLERMLHRAYNASEDARPFFDWLCAAFEDALDLETYCSPSSLGSSWSVLSEEESEAYEELRALGVFDESVLAEYSDKAVDGLSAPATVDEELEASIELLSEQLKQVQEHVKALDVQHQCLLNSQEAAASKSSMLAKQESVAEQALVDLDSGVRALSLQMDAAVTEAATSAGKLADLAFAEQTPPTARLTHHHHPPAYLHQCTAEIAAWNNADRDLDAWLSASIDGVYPKDPREPPDLLIFADLLPAEGGPPELDLPPELAAELERLTSLYSLTERDHHIALLRAAYSKEKLAALEEHTADRKGVPPRPTTTSHPTPADPTSETRHALATLQHLWNSIAARSTSIPFLASIYTAARAERTSRLDAATALTQDLRASLSRATLLHYNMFAERRVLREQSAAMLAVAEHVATADTGLTQRIAALSTTSTTTAPARDDAGSDDALAGFLTRIAQTASSHSARDGGDGGPDTHSDFQHQTPWERIAVRETLPWLAAQTDTLWTLLGQHALTAVPLLAPKELLDGEQAVKEATSDLGRALRDASAMAAAAGGVR